MLTVRPKGHACFGTAVRLCACRAKGIALLPKIGEWRHVACPEGRSAALRAVSPYRAGSCGRFLRLLRHISTISFLCIHNWFSLVITRRLMCNRAPRLTLLPGRLTALFCPVGGDVVLLCGVIVAMPTFLSPDIRG